MSLETSRIVDVTITTTPRFQSRGGFGTLNVVGISDVINLAERIRYYANIDGVAEDFASTDEEYIAAQVYFSQKPSPDRIAISRRADQAYAAELLCGLDAEQTLATWLAISDGEFTISIDGVADDILAVNTSAVTSLDDVATAIETELQAIAAGGFTAATCEWDGSRFIIKSGTTGATSTISVMSEVSGGLGTSIVTLCDGAENATAVAGVDTETITDSLNIIEAISSDWRGLAFTKELNDENADIILAAEWVEARTKLFANSSTDANVKDSLSTSDIAYVLSQGSYKNTFTSASFSDEDYISVSVFARIATVNYDGTDTTITLKFKQLPTITADSLSSNEADNISNKNCNYYAPVGGNDMFAEGVCADSSFIDTVHGVQWLEVEMEDRVFQRLYSDPNKVPFTDKGAQQLVEKVRETLDQAVTNGLIAPGETQDGEFLSLGYEVTVVKVADVSDSDKQNRIGPTISFIALGAGAIHFVEINGTFEA